MAIYNVNKVVKFKRKSLGFTHEELATNISVQTLSRIENFRTSVSLSVYHDLMSKMGQLPDEPCTPINLNSLEQLDMMYEITSFTNQENYELAREKIELLSSTINMNTLRNRQYIEHKLLEVDFGEGKISEKDYIKRLIDILKYTIPEYDNIDIGKWPLNVLEIDILISLDLFYQLHNQHNDAYNLALKLKESFETGYMNGIEFDLYYITILYYLANITGNLGFHKKAIEYSRLGIEYSIRCNTIGMMLCLYYDIAWNTEQLIEKKLLPESDKSVALEYLRRSYYFSVASDYKYYADFVVKHIETLYQSKK